MILSVNTVDGSCVHFRLNSFVTHNGDNFNSGHYKAKIVKSAKRQSLFVCNDRFISQQSCLSNTDLKSVYMLVYDRVYDVIDPEIVQPLMKSKGASVMYENLCISKKVSLYLCTLLLRVCATHPEFMKH